MSRIVYQSDQLLVQPRLQLADVRALDEHGALHVQPELGFEFLREHQRH